MKCTAIESQVTIMRVKNKGTKELSKGDPITTRDIPNKVLEGILSKVLGDILSKVQEDIANKLPIDIMNHQMNLKLCTLLKIDIHRGRTDKIVIKPDHQPQPAAQFYAQDVPNKEVGYEWKDQMIEANTTSRWEVGEMH